MRRHEWVVNDRSEIYGTEATGNPAGFHLLREVVTAAHRHGVEVHAVAESIGADGKVEGDAAIRNLCHG